MNMHEPMRPLPVGPNHAAPAAAADVRVRPWYRRPLAWLAVLAVVAGVAAYVLLRGIAGGDAAKQAPEVPRVTVIKPGTQLVTAAVNATGTLAARREMPVGVVGEGGMVSRVLVEPGEWVKAGQTLAVIERSVQAQQLEQLRAQILVAEADLKLAQAELDRALSLVDRGFISKADIDRKTATRDSARAQLAVARAQAAEQQARLGRLDIRAPAAGLVLTRNVEPGQVVGVGGQALFNLAKDGEFELVANVAETDMRRITVGTAAAVTPVGSTRQFPGQVWQLSPTVDPRSRQGKARILLGYDAELRPGGFASAEIVSGTANVPLLPESAVQSDRTGNFVMIVNGRNEVERRNVEVGAVTDAGIAVRKGLTGSEAVVLSAGAFLNPRDKVIAVPAKPAK